MQTINYGLTGPDISRAIPLSIHKQAGSTEPRRRRQGDGSERAADEHVALASQQRGVFFILVSMEGQYQINQITRQADVPDRLDKEAEKPSPSSNIKTTISLNKSFTKKKHNIFLPATLYVSLDANKT